MSVEDENLTVTGIIDCVQSGNSVSFYVYVFLSVLKAGEVWRWDEKLFGSLKSLVLGRGITFAFWGDSWEDVVKNR